ncbi:MAG: UvrD-helicase domain-containing protein [Chitinophagaceae bacterium]|nr:UvrD-helicase domain-containing protein [Chitinophagaceae bacterium]
MQKAWVDLENIKGDLPYKHEHYLKSWHLAGPVIPADFILFDEAQDANPVLLACVLAQKNAQKILVGDSNQQIMEFTGAVDALEKTGIEKHVYLSQSFRFGPAIAEQANRVLQALDARLRLRGFDKIDSVIDFAHSPDCYLTRTNASGRETVCRRCA